jgi:hypothetical protein
MVEFHPVDFHTVPSKPEYFKLNREQRLYKKPNKASIQ